MSIKVLVSAYACDPSRGGEFNNGWNYAYNAKNGFDIWCITTDEGESEINHFLARESIPGLHMVFVRIPRWMRNIKNNIPNYGVYLHYWYFQTRAYKLARELDKEINFDVVHHATYASLQLGTFTWRLQKPMIFGPVGGGQTAPRSFKKYFYHHWHLEWLREMVSKLMLNIVKTPVKALRRADVTLVVNQETYDLAKSYGAKRLEYAPCTLLPDAFGPNALPTRQEHNPFQLLWVGRLLPRKGLRLVLEAIAELEIPVKLTIIGDSGMASKLPDWLKELHLEERVVWMGRQPIDVVRQAYASHDVFVYCSLRESLAAQFFEAMAFGLPMVILNLHGAKTFVPDEAALKVNLSDPEQTVRGIRAAILELYADGAKRKLLGANAFQLAGQFTYSHRIRSINKLYKELAQAANQAAPTGS